MADRRLIPGRWNRHGRAVLDTPLHEMDCEVGIDPNRVIAAPVCTPEDRIFIARMRRWALLRAAGGVAAMAGLLALFGARCFKS